MAFPELDEKQVNRIAFGSYRNFAITLVEILSLPSLTKEELIYSVNCENPEFIIQKHNEGNGLILLSAHFGNWEYIAISVPLQIEKKITVIVKQLRNRLVSDWMNKMRTRWKNDVVPLGASIRQVYKVLKDKNIVAMVADQRGPEESIKLEFFGRKTSVFVGPAVLALKTGAPLVYGIAIRQTDFRYHLKLIEISKDDLPENENEKIKTLCKRSLEYLESVIREYPDQWLWMHNRWRH